MLADIRLAGDIALDFPLGLSIFTPGAAPQMRSWLTKFMQKNGRWIIALICLGFGAHMYKGAFDVWPG